MVGGSTRLGSRLHRAALAEHRHPTKPTANGAGETCALRRDAAMTDRILNFLRNRREAGRDTGPCLVVDLDVVRDNYHAFAR